MFPIQGNSVRLVIQLVRDDPKLPPQYHVVAYPGPRGGTLNSRFSSRQELLERLRQTMPDFDEECLAGTSEVTQIVFAEFVELSSAQLSSLGLVD
jgi:hypothetical protein